MSKIRGFEFVTAENRQNKGELVHRALPKRSTTNSAGYDFILPKNVSLLPHQTIMVWSDIKAYMLSGEFLQLFIRSSIGKKGIILANCTGIIDSDYYNNEGNEGNIGFMLTNLTSDVVELYGGTKIVQGIFTKYLITDTDDVSEERTGGFGSTGK